MGIIKDPTSWRAGFELGLAGFSFPYSKPRKPTAYLYNGIRLPALPEWDRGVYPYAVIILWGEHVGRPEYRAHALMSKSYIEDIVSVAGNKIKRVILDAPRLYAYFGESYPNYPSGWGDYSANGWIGTDYDGFNELTQNEEQHGRIIWSNHDILNEDGTVYFAKCDEPTPIYE